MNIINIIIYLFILTSTIASTISFNKLNKIKTVLDYFKRTGNPGNIPKMDLDQAATFAKEKVDKLLGAVDDLEKERVDRKKQIDDWVKSFKEQHNGNEPTNEDKANDIFVMYQEVENKLNEVESSLTSHVASLSTLYEVKQIKRRTAAITPSSVNPTVAEDNNVNDKKDSVDNDKSNTSNNADISNDNSDTDNVIEIK